MSGHDTFTLTKVALAIICAPAIWLLVHEPEPLTLLLSWPRANGLVIHEGWLIVTNHQIQWLPEMEASWPNPRELRGCGSRSKHCHSK